MATTVEVLLRTVGGPGAAVQGAGGGGNGSSNAGGGGGGGPTDKDIVKDRNILKSISGGMSKFIRGKLGLNFTLSAMLKQSQIFTSTVGVIFQLLGALVDVILAPFLPLIVPIIRTIGKMIPWVQGWMQRNISPKVDAIVKWVDGFFSTFDGSWSMLFGEEGLGGLANKFSQWWDGTASGWIGDQLIAMKDGVVNQLGALWDWFKGTDTRMQGWIITFFATQFARIPLLFGELGKLVWAIIQGVGKFVLSIPGRLLKFTAHLVKSMFPVVGHIVVGLIKGAWKLSMWILKGIGGFIVKLGIKIVKDIGTALIKLPKLIFAPFTGLVQKILKALGEKLGSLPVIGGMFKKLAGGGLLKAIGGMAKASKAIPVVGAIATAGFGAVETYQMAKKHGWKAGLAYGTKTVAATAMAAGGMTAGSLALDIGGTMALNRMFAANNKNQGTPNVNLTINAPEDTQQRVVSDMRNARNRDINMELEFERGI